MIRPDEPASGTSKVAGIKPARERFTIIIQAIALSLARFATSKSRDCATDERMRSRMVINLENWYAVTDR